MRINKTVDCGHVALVSQEELDKYKWQPIETAPKCGRTIEVCDVMHQETNMIVGWDTHAEKRNDKYSWTTGDMNYHKDLFTHWKEITPQPEPPKEKP